MEATPPPLHRGTPWRPLGAYLESVKKDGEPSSTEEECEIFRKRVLVQILNGHEPSVTSERPGGPQSSLDAA